MNIITWEGKDISELLERYASNDNSKERNEAFFNEFQKSQYTKDRTIRVDEDCTYLFGIMVGMNYMKRKQHEQ